jgi:hypothetical protein
LRMPLRAQTVFVCTNQHSVLQVREEKSLVGEGHKLHTTHFHPVSFKRKRSEPLPSFETKNRTV